MKIFKITDSIPNQSFCNTNCQIRAILMVRFLLKWQNGRGIGLLLVLETKDKHYLGLSLHYVHKTSKYIRFHLKLCAFLYGQEFYNGHVELQNFYYKLFCV